MLTVKEAEHKYLSAWDDLVDKSVNGTLFHKREFLRYHGGRFASNERYLVFLKGDTPVAQICFTLERNIETIVRSPYGGSYGSFVFQRYPSYSESQEIVSLFLSYCAENNVSKISLTSPIVCCAPYPLDTFNFSLLNAGFKLVNRDISSVVPLDPSQPVIKRVSPDARNLAKKAEKNGIQVVTKGDIDHFYEVLADTYAKHGTNPTHTKEQLSYLNQVMPERVYVDVAYANNIPVAGVGVFVINDRVTSSFYLCQKTDYRHYQGLTLLILNALERSEQEGFSWFDFGTSSVGMHARENIFHFKEQFSKVGVFRETYEWKASL